MSSRPFSSLPRVRLGTKIQSMSLLPTFVTIGPQMRLGGVPGPRTTDLQIAKNRLSTCRVPISFPDGKYLRVANDQRVAILELVRFNRPWTPRVSWVTRTRHLLPRRTLYSRQLPIEVSPQDLSRLSVHPNAPSHLSGIWHYMRDWKFADMIDKSAIFLSRADLVSDSFEGTVSLGNLRNRSEVYRNRSRKMANRYAVIVRELANIKRWTYLSCWRIDEHECPDAWHSYVRGANGVAIKTTYRKLLDYTATIFCAGVEYIDFDHNWVIEENPLLPFTYKRTPWQWEREFRIIIQQFPQAAASLEDALYYDCTKENTNCGLTFGVDLRHFIAEIVVAPSATEEYFEEVRCLAGRLGIDNRVRRSTLCQDPRAVVQLPNRNNRQGRIVPVHSN